MRRDPWHLLDAAVPLWTAAAVAVGVLYRSDGSVWLLALALPAALVLFLRRRAPGLTLAVSGGLVLALIAVDPTAGAMAVLAPAVALYSYALDRGRAHLVAAAIVAVLAVVAAETLLAGEALTMEIAAHVALVAVPLLAAEAVRNHRSYARLLLERAELAEQTREEEAQRRVEQERLRIARELHDIVAHTITTINVQAGVAAHLIDRDPSHAKEALATIEAASHDALDELRAVLGVLRDGRDERAPLEPVPRLADIEGLLRQARDSGLEADLDADGEVGEPVPDAVQLAAYRIVQESLTNACRHAPASTARVRVSYGPGRLRLTVENDLAGGGIGAPGDGVVNPGGATPASASSACGSAPKRSEAPSRPEAVTACSVWQPSCRTGAAHDPRPRHRRPGRRARGFATLIAAPSPTCRSSARPPTAARPSLSRAARQPDVVLMDIRMPVLDGLEATRLICARPGAHATRVLVLTTFDLDEYVYAALRAGASGFLLKDAGPGELLQAIRTVAAGDALIAPSITKTPHRRVRGAARIRSDRRPALATSPSANARSSGWWRRAAPTPRSPSYWSSARSRPRPTSATSSPSSPAAIGPSSSRSPTRAVSWRPGR